MTEIERIDQLREELHRHNYNYYVLNAPEITDQEFDKLMRELQDLEEKHPEHRDENSPSMRVGSDINKNFMQVVHKYPMLSLKMCLDFSGTYHRHSHVYIQPVLLQNTHHQILHTSCRQ